MIHVPSAEFEVWMNEAIAGLPKDHRKAIKNVAFFVRDNPSPEQLERAGVQPGSLLLGVYEGVPLSQRQGVQPYLPDRITLFQEPIEQLCHDIGQLKEQIRHTVWHEVAHYFGLSHDDIRTLE